MPLTNSLAAWERWRLWLLALAIGLIVVVPFLLLQNLSRQSLKAADAVAHTYRVEAAVRGLTVELRETEGAAMAIALGIDIPFTRQRLTQGLAAVGPRLERVLRLTSDNRAQQVRLGQLKELLQRRLATATRLADASTPEAATSAVRELVVLYPVRVHLRELLDEERALLQERIDTAQRKRDQGLWLGTGAMLAQLLLLGLVILLLGRQVKQRLQAERSSARASDRALAVLQTVREPIVLLDAQQRILMHNAAFAELYGLPPDRPPGMLGDVGSGEWRDPVLRQRLSDVLARDRELWDFEHQQRTPEGLARTVLVNARRMPLPDRDDHVVLMTLSDVSAQKATQQRVVELNRQLEGKVAQVSDVNRELEAFSYSVSHDLRAPLRHVAGFADKLGRHLGESADDKSRHYLQVIGDSARRMSMLIDDLLVYSRLGRSAMRLQAVDMQSLVDETRSMLESNAQADRSSAAPQVEWRIDPLPILVGDENMLRGVWQNLLGNAVKYSARRELAVIEVTYAQQADGTHEFAVSDNGAGFDMAYAAKLFGVFQRLHKASEFPGTGIGLASVRRVLSRHGGRIWAESSLGAGSTFRFTLPSALDAPPSEIVA
ncbi:MAG TPA: ATP-binding protein [Pseudoxanthomonas sp.]|nr:ATP-binding protein [Pseudoxanthomonas sp.]